MHADAARRTQAREDEQVGGREKKKFFVLKYIQGFSPSCPTVFPHTRLRITRPPGKGRADE